MKHAILLSVFAVIILAGIAFMWSREGKEETQDPPQQEEFIWTLYRNEDQGFSLEYMEGMEIQFPDGQTVHFFEVGPTQAMETEFYDGFSFRIEKKDISQGTLASYIDLYIERESMHMTVLQGPDPVELAGYPGYFFQAEGLVGVPYTVYVIQVSSDEFFEITLMTPDPTGQGYEASAARMLATFSVIE